MTTPEKINLLSADIRAERIAALKALFPEAFAEGLIDFVKLREAVGELVDDSPERYNFTWAGKRDAIRMLQAPTAATLVPCPNESVSWNTTRHVFVEGDNLEVLKLLHRAYFGKVKLIYIDPPYNKGKDFIYPDDYADPLRPYLQLTGQSDSNGNLTTTNAEGNGRFHSTWLSMMYSRLSVARQLLRDDGFIAVSIEEREVGNLRIAMNEIFGEENFTACLVWQSKKGGGNDAGAIVADHEYVLCYAKFIEASSLSRVEIESEALNLQDDRGPYRLGRELNKWGSNSRREDRPTMHFPIPGPNGEEVYPIRNDGTEGCWRWGTKKMLAIVNRGDVEYVRRPNGTYIVYEKIRSTDPRAKPYRTWLSDVGATSEGSKVVKDLFGGRKVFDFPKPMSLLERLIAIGTADNDDIVMDFFAGSCTTAHSVLKHNRIHATNIRFVMIQLPEVTLEPSEAKKMGFGTVADIGKERIRRAIEEFSKDAHEPTKDDIRDEPEDLGFRVFKLASSKFQTWHGVVSPTSQDYLAQMRGFGDPLFEGFDPQEIIWEVAVKEGYPLTSRVEKVAIESNRVYRVTNPDTGHYFHICLDAPVSGGLVNDLRLKQDDLFVCRDIAINDSIAANLALNCRLKTI